MFACDTAQALYIGDNYDFSILRAFSITDYTVSLYRATLQ